MQNPGFRRKLSIRGMQLVQSKLPDEISQTPLIPVANPGVKCSISGAGIVEVEKPSILILSEKEEKEIKFISKHSKLTISERNKYMKFYDKIMLAMPVISLLSTMYFLQSTSLSPEETAFDLAIWILFFVDFVLRFFKEFTNRKKQIIQNIKLISKRYLEELLIPDLIALIPLRLFGHFKFECLLRLFRIIRIPRFFNLIDMNRLSYKLAGFAYKSECLAKKILVLKILTVWEIIMQVIEMVFITFLVSCLWYNYSYHVYTNDFEPNNFIQDFNLADDSKSKRFIKSWYFIFTTLSTVGYGDFYATNKHEQWFAILLVLAGPTWFAFTMGKAIQFLNQLQDLKGNGGSMKEVYLWMKEIESVHGSIQYQNKVRILSHFKNFFKHDRLGPLLNESDESDFDIKKTSDRYFEHLPECIQNELILYLFDDIFYTFRVFFKTFKKARYDIARCLEPRIYKAGETLIHHGEFVKEMLLASSGSINTYFNDLHCTEERKRLYTLQSPFVIGDVYAIKKIQCLVEYEAKTMIKGFAIQTFAFLEIAKLKELDFNLYEQRIKPMYSKLERFSTESLSKRNDITKENIDANEIRKLTFRSSSPITCPGFNYEIDTDEGNSVDAELKRVENIVKAGNQRRKSLISSLKSKLSLHILTNIK